MLKAGIIKPVHETMPWINSFILIKGKDQVGNLKLHICQDPTNVNKAVIRELYHFKTLEDITHLIANSCVMIVCNCKKGYLHQELDRALFFPNNIQYGTGKIPIYGHAHQHYSHKGHLPTKTRPMLQPH